MKVCKYCNQTKEKDQFYASRSAKSNKDGLRPYCKGCCAKKHKNYRNHPGVKEKLHQTNSEWHKNNKERSNLRHKIWQQDNKEHYYEYKKDYNNKNRNYINARGREWSAKTRKNNPIFKLKDNLRRRINKAIESNYKSGSAVRDLGCSIDELKKHLESQFKVGMTWDNWSRTGWHIDHIKPLANFDLTSPEQFKEAVNYTNLQPLWARENISKGSKIV